MQNELFLMLPGGNAYSPVLLWGLSVVRAVQSVQTPGLTSVMSLISSLGVGMIIPGLTVLFWCIDQKKGIRLEMILVVSSWTNSVLKVLLKQPRPFNLDPSVGLAIERTYGFPSGHAQMSLVFYVIAAFYIVQSRSLSSSDSSGAGKKRFVWIVAAFIIVLIAFTRVYLGVHFPTDITGGWFLGGALLALFFLCENRITKLLEAVGLRGQLIAAAAISLLMIILYPGDLMLSGIFLGVAGGYALMLKKVPYSAGKIPNGKIPMPLCRILRFLLGSAGAALIYLYLGRILPGSALFQGVPAAGSIYQRNYELGVFIHFGILGFWISAAAPFIFVNLKIMGGGG